MDENVRIKEVLKGAAIESFFYFLVAQAISFSVGEQRQPLLGYWTVPVTFILVFTYIVLIKYVPNYRADNELRKKYGEKYVILLNEQTNNKSYRALLKENWFIDLLKKPGPELT